MDLVYCLKNSPNLCFYVGTNKLTYTYFSKLINTETNEEMGEFTISGKFDTGNTVDMGIRVDDNLRGMGISRELIRLLCIYIMEVAYPKIRKDQLLFIDTDASEGFWDYIGMKEHPYGIDYEGYRDLEGVGYEKKITFGEICNWAGAPLPVNGGRRKQRKTNKSKKQRKTNKSKKQRKTNKSKKQRKKKNQ